MMIYRFRKSPDEAITDYLKGIDRDYNKAVIVENAKDGKIETEKYKVSVVYLMGGKERLKISERKAKR